MTQKNDGKEEKGALRTDQNHLIFGQGFSFSGYERDALFMNLGTKKFMDISGVSGIDSVTDGRASVFADFDNDGDYDVFLTTIQGPSHLLFRNNVGQDNNFLRISLEGTSTGRDAFSAVVRLKTSTGTLTKIKSGGSGFISQHDPRLLFGLGKDERALGIEVTWPNGKVEQFDGELKANSTLLLKEGTGRMANLTLARAKLPDPLTRAQAFAKGLKVAVGSRLPDIVVKTMDGKTTSLHKQLHPGRRTLINVWATWCVPCAKEMPELERLRARLSANGIDLIGLNVNSDVGADVRGFVAEKRVKYPVYLGGVSAIEGIYATEELAVPLSVLVDEKGIVTDIIPGWSAETQKKFTALSGASVGIAAK